MQLSHVLAIKSGAIVIGNPMSGKSTGIRVLARGLNKVVDNLDQMGNRDQDTSTFQADLGVPFDKPGLRECITAEVLNPKSLAMAELYGRFSHLSQEWKDGLASSIIRDFSTEASTAGPPSSLLPGISKMQRWVVFDGPVDTFWVENLNTVLDENMTLCLANGERIKLNKRLRLIFECDSLATCSPSTVSRCGVVYFDSDTVNWRHLVQAWEGRAELKEEQLHYVSSLFESTIDSALLFMKRNTPQVIQRPAACLVGSVLALLDILLTKGFAQLPLTTSREQLKNIIRRVYLFSLAWAMAGMTSDAMPKIEGFLSTEFPANDLPKGSLFESHLSLECEPLSAREQSGNFGSWAPWRSIAPREIEPPPLPLLARPGVKAEQPLEDGYDLAEA